MLAITPQSPQTASPQGTTRRSRQSRRNHEVKEKVRLVVGDLEAVVAELKTVVVDLKVLVHQIDLVTDKLDERFGLNWRETESLTFSGDEGSLSSATVRNSSCSQAQEHVDITCDSFQLHRLLYMPQAPDDCRGKMKGHVNGYALTAEIISECFKSKRLPILDCNQNEAFVKDFMESSSSNASEGSEFLPPTFTSEDDSYGGTAEIDLLVRQAKPFDPNRATCDNDRYSGIYEAELDEKLENYVSFMDSFDSSDEEDYTKTGGGFSSFATLPDATDARTRYSMVSSWAESAMYNLTLDNLTSEESGTPPDDPPTVAMNGEGLPKSSIGGFSLISEVVLFQNEVQQDVPPYRSVLVY